MHRTATRIRAHLPPKKSWAVVTALTNTPANGRQPRVWVADCEKPFRVEEDLADITGFCMIDSVASDRPAASCETLSQSYSQACSRLGAGEPILVALFEQVQLFKVQYLWDMAPVSQ